MTRRLAEIGCRGGTPDLLAGGGADPDTGRLLSIAQLQEALRHRNRAVAATAPTLHRLPNRFGLPAQVSSSPPRHPEIPRAASGPLADFAPIDRHDGALASPGTVSSPRSWLLVMGAHAGVGCSSTALAIADSAALAGSTVHLVEAAQPGSPAGAGLAAVTHHELGVVAGGWRRGRRGRVMIDRPTSSEASIWPPSPSDDHDRASGPPVTILDAGTAWPCEPAKGIAPLSSWWSLTGTAPAGVVVVCRASIPSVTCAERTLEQLYDLFCDHRGHAMPIVVAAVGGHRWRGPVKAAVGPALSRLQERHLVVGVPHLRYLEISGPTGEALPRSLTAAGHTLWTLATANAPIPTGGPR